MTAYEKYGIETATDENQYSITKRCPMFNPKHYKIMPKSNASKVTSPKAAAAASKVLRDGRTSSASKTAAGSALSQTPSKRK